MEAPKVTLIDGREMPVIGLGTWPLDDEAAERVVSDAISAGYRHIDTAVRYGNETGVGRGLASSGLPRDALFVTTKLDGEFQDPSAQKPACAPHSTGSDSRASTCCSSTGPCPSATSTSLLGAPSSVYRVSAWRGR